MVVLGSGLLAMVLLHFRATRSSARPMPKSAPQPAATPPGPTPQLARELDELGKRLADELDARADRLERLIADADERLGRLERLTAATVHALQDSAPGLAEVKHIGNGQHRDPYAASLTAQTPKSAAAILADIDPLANDVYKLADSGLLPVQIAQKLSQHTGKIELLLALRRG